MVRCSYSFDYNSLIVLKVNFISAQIVIINQVHENVFALGFVNVCAEELLDKRGYDPILLGRLQPVSNTWVDKRCGAILKREKRQRGANR